MSSKGGVRGKEEGGYSVTSSSVPPLDQLGPRDTGRVRGRAWGED